MNFNKCFRDKTVLVTGSSRGIGKDIAISFAHLGAKVVINYNKNYKLAKDVYDYIIKKTGNAIMVKADVSKVNEVKKMVSYIKEQFGKIEILVNNAGIVGISSFVQIKESEFDKIISVNLKGAFICSQEIVKDMIKNKYGKIINISSTLGKLAQLNMSHYCIAKSGVVMLTKTMAYELGRYNINVNCIGPATIETDLSKEYIARKDIKLKERKAYPLKRKVGKTKDIANLTLFLASDYASWITGQFIMIDGGLTCRTPQEFYPV